MKQAKQKSFADIFDDLAPPPSEQYLSVGGCCLLMDVNPLQLRTLMDAAGVRFDRILDGVAYVNGNSVVKIMGECKKCRDEIEAAANSVSSN